MTAWLPPGDMDPECVALCVEMNRLSGIQTTESCCGHGVAPFQIWFTASRIDDLAPIATLTDGRMGGLDDWTIKVECHDYDGQPRFVLEGPVGAFRARPVADTDWLAEALRTKGTHDDLAT